MTTPALWQLDACALVELTSSGRVSCREVVASTLERLHAVNPTLNAITLALDESALAAADAADRARASGAPLGPLHGVPFTSKINTDHLGCASDDGLAAFAKRMPREDSPPVARLRAAGAIAVGRSNSPALGLAQNASNDYHGTTLNPWDERLMSGGSSGGAAVAVAVGIGAIGQGNDLGGSLRWPAYCNGVIGLRPSPGIVPYYNSTYRGGMVFCEQLMTVNGPITRSVRDARLALSIMAGVDVRDPVTVPVTVWERRPTGPLRVALVTGEGGALSPVHASISAAVRRAGAHLAAAGYEVEEVEPPLIDSALELFDCIVGTEVSHSLRPLLGKFIDPLMAALVNGMAERTAAVTVDAYMAALRERDEVIRRWQLFMQERPLVVLPPCTEPSLPRHGEDLDHAVFDTYRKLRSLRLSPLLGFPAIAVPLSLPGSTAAGQPLGVDIMAPRYREDLCLAAAEAIEAREGVRPALDALPGWPQARRCE